jgi:hypothetical protein
MRLQARRRLNPKPEEAELLRKKSNKVPRIYIVDEPPLTFKAGEKEYECKDILQTPQGVICVQYDNTMVYVTPNQQAQQQPAPMPSTGLVLV